MKKSFKIGDSFKRKLRNLRREFGSNMAGLTCLLIWCCTLAMLLDDEAAGAVAEEELEPRWWCPWWWWWWWCFWPWEDLWWPEEDLDCDPEAAFAAANMGVGSYSPFFWARRLSSSSFDCNQDLGLNFLPYFNWNLAAISARELILKIKVK